jgi:cyclic beta-1,2-glucan synthetase
MTMPITEQADASEKRERPGAPELLSQDRLEAQAVALAESHTISPDVTRGQPLLPRLDESARRLEEAYEFLAAAGRNEPQSGSEDWLRDNHHIVQDQIREIRQDLPRKYYLELPKLAAGGHEGYPRVYVIAQQLIAHTAARLDLQTLVGFVRAYQRVSPLSMGEVWAIAIMLRLTLVEELQRLADRVSSARRSRQRAQRWSTLLASNPDDPAGVMKRLLQEEQQTNGDLSAAFVVELLQFMRDQPPNIAPAWHVLHEALAAQGDVPETMLRDEHYREAADQLAIGNVITTMRLLSSIDWPLFFEQVSLVEEILRDDPVDAYERMDFATRDRYRHSVEELAKRAKESELEVARRVVELARDAMRTAPQNDRAHHIGYYLISRGRFHLERGLRYPPTPREHWARFVFRHPAVGYLGTVASLIVLSVASLMAYADRHGASAVELMLVALFVALPTSELAISVVHLILTSLVPPRPLPKLDLRAGIPSSDRTIVVVPAIIDSEARLISLLDDLEVRFFANRDPNLHFALLTDFADADQETLPEDEPILAAARQRVDALNQRHGSDRFLLFHRKRQWNPAERRWMGHERKRGKLAEFNKLIRGVAGTSFIVQHGDLLMLRSIRYVITLDSDTQLPIEVGRRLVGTMSHPLNRPRFDTRLQRVTEGYGVLQPRVTVSTVSANRTAFAQIFSGYVGVDPYTTAVSDVYQDLFHEGSYVGKGIYDVDAFEAALNDRVPANTLLSHDLFEGFYARAGLCTDIELIDDYPANYLAFSARLHRWVRGDWQIVRWLWRSVPNAEGRSVPNTLPIISRWKILDNLRRSLLPPSLVALLVTGWTILPGSAAMWTTLALMVLTFPAYVQFARSLGSRVRGVPIVEHMRAEAAGIATSLRQAAMSITLLAHQSAVMLDAIGRVLVRILITRRRLLEWVSADRFEQVPLTVRNLFRRMWPAPVLAGATATAIAMIAPGRLLLATPILTFWVLSPVVAYRTGLPRPLRRLVLTTAQRAVFRHVARRTWRFFDDFVGPTDHWLAPDNYQENRSELLAHRTSPTNIGLQLLSTVAAHDLGYLGVTALLDRLEPTFDTLLRLQRYRGHFYNWYDTRSLVPLAPAYISTVDSGNLAGYLLTLRAALHQLVETSPIIDGMALAGLRDVVDLLEAEIRPMPASRTSGRLRRELAQLREQLAQRPATLQEWRRLLAQLAERVQSAGVVLTELEESFSTPSSRGTVSSTLSEAAYWLERTAIAVAARESELKLLTGWITHPSSVPSLVELVRWCDQALEAGGDPSAVLSARQRVVELIERAERLAALADDFVEEMEFGFLFNRDLQLFSIGFSVSDGRLDSSYYDMLASEARLASYLGIATDSVLHSHWFRLGRSLTQAGMSRVLLSWSASMFEYLMPVLLMREYPSTLLDETYTAVVRRQIQYGRLRGRPWGVSESAYNLQDLEGNYQYRAFGVPGLGLKRGLADDLVVAPYASILACRIAPVEVLRNLEELTAEGMLGPMGYYEAIDYTPERVPEGHEGGVVLRTYFAHHQGMSLLALDNLLNATPMQARFHADPRIQAADVLLQERIPQLVPLKNPPAETVEHVPTLRRAGPPPARRYLTPHTLSPRTHLLSNGSYNVMVTNAGGGYSRRQSIALTRWREDVTRDCWGSFCYVRDVESGEVWSTTYQPTRREPEEYEATFALDRAVWRRLDAGLETRTELVVSPEDDVELRRVSITNHTSRSRSLDLTSYAEVLIAPHDADLAHPVFSNLFVETRAVPEYDALICVRRPRMGVERLHLIHVLSGRARIGMPTEYETDRARFIGRGGTLEQPVALARGARLSNTTGPVLDPIVSLRQSIRLPPGGTARLSFVTGFADGEVRAAQLIEKYHDRRAVARAFALASTHSQVELRHLGLTLEDTLRFQRLAGRLLTGDPRLRSHEAAAENRRSQAELWKYGISGDLPIVLVRIADETGIGLFRELLKAHEYLRHKGLLFDLVVLNERGVTYLQDLQDALQAMLTSSPEHPWADRPGGVFLRRADLMAPEDQLLLRATARAVMDAAQGPLHQQLVRPEAPFRPHATPALPGAEPETLETRVPASFPHVETLESFNGYGGFAENGCEYQLRVRLRDGLVPPAPWSIVVAHASFGFVATELGCGYTWSGNSHDNRLTPWSNDPVGDPQGEVLFLRDEETATFWSVTPLPAGDGLPYTVRHGFGYTMFEHVREEIASTLRLSVVPGEPVKVFHLRLRNASSRSRRLSITLYVEWVLGEHRSRTSLHVVTSRDPATGALLVSNAFRNALGNRVAFLDLFPGADRTLTGDRTEFIGRNGSLRSPAALGRDRLSDRVGATLDPCGAIRVQITLDPGEDRTIVGLLGDAADDADARRLVERYRDPKTIDSAFDHVRQFWWSLLRTVQVRTPDRSFDLLLNGWLQYQTLACRIWGRSAFYQSSGAFGFRDQLQDVLGFLLGEPQLARAHLLRAASRQFVEGDVQHWWHEPSGQGVRTRFSDDRLWLVFATLEYVAVTGDHAVLDEEVAFLEGRPLNPDEHDAYELPTESKERSSLYDHCLRAVAISMGTGSHGLPLMGGGDWNDGMNLVGAGGKGESVWLGWFLIAILRPFADLAEARGEIDRATIYRRHADALAAAVENAWDGEWYRRAYFDDGTPLGSKMNQECRIDSLAQSWAVISGAADQARATQAIESSLRHLVRRNDRLIALLTPPFDRMTPSPGYIQGYVPGVRENGGQYTHAALWTILAVARLGDGDSAMNLFSLINPINRTRTAEEVGRYRAEPYVVAADVYSEPPHVGRAGWTWYTGSAGWMYRVGLESLLGLTRAGSALKIEPCIPRSWPRYEISFRMQKTEYHIVVENPQGVSRGVRVVEFDGVELPHRLIELADDGGVHQVRIVLGGQEPGAGDRD